MRIQKNKCAYCERKLGGEAYGKAEHDVEHFRPKNAVKAWPPEKSKKKYDFPTGKETERGYYLLAYNHLNYTTACKSCDSSLKSNYFPIAGSRITNSDDFERLKKEKPYLIYPIGDINEDPESLLTFAGIVPVPKAKRGHRHRRARVTIDFFALDIRDELLKMRARIIQIIFSAYETANNPNIGAESQTRAQKIINLALSPASEHTNCARAFYRLCRTDIEKAREYVRAAERILPNE